MDYTPILKLSLPPFDDVPWDEAINGDMQILDAAVGQFFGVANVVGIWRNGIAYASGQSVVDAVDSSMWTCSVSHTSPAAPTTFPQDRIDNPTRWINIVSSAHDYAQQAANSATAANDAKVAAQAAQAAAEAAAAHVAGALPLSGGTMTGSITLAGDPTAVLHAATKQYVDARVGGTGYLPTTGGTLTGALTLASNPTVALHAATKQYVDARTGLYLPLGGGTLSGILGVGGTGIVYSNYSQGHVMAFGWNGSVVTMYVDGSYVGSPATGTYVPTSGGGFSGPISATSVATNAGGNYMFGDANYAGISFDTWQLRYARATGTLGYYRGSDGATLFAIDYSGTGFFQGNLSANGNFAAGGTIISNNIITGLDVNANRNMTATGNIQALGVHYSGNGYYAAGDNSMAFAPFPTQRLLQYAVGWYWQWVTANGDLNWYTVGGATFQIRASDAWVIALRSRMAGIGPYTDLSDAASKTDIEVATHGLAAILGLTPKTFKRIGFNETELGFVAQDVQQVLPEAVMDLKLDGHEGASLGIATTPIIAALVNAVKELRTMIGDARGS